MAALQPSTQQFVKLESVRDGIVIMRGGAMRVVLNVSSLNFALKSQDEQEAIIIEYQNFLNSLDFPVQIYVSSRFLNIDEYTSVLGSIGEEQANDLLRLQTREYVKFIKEFVESTNIVSTDFFVIVPLNVFEVEEKKKGGILGTVASLFGRRPTEMTEERFAHYRSQIVQRADFVAAGLHRLGIVTRVLPTEELVMFFWNLYNPEGLKRRSVIRPLYEQ